MSAPNSLGPFAIVHGLLKLLSIVVGIVLSQICLMALVGLLTGHGLVRLVAALAVNLVVPLILVDSMLPDENPTHTRGLASDVLALLWLGFPVLFAVAGHSLASPTLAREAGRLVHSGFPRTARVTYILAGVFPVAPALRPVSPAAPPTGSASVAIPVPSGSAPLADAGVPDARADVDATSRSEASGEMSPSEIFELMSPSVVTVKASGVGGMAEPEGGGTGFLIDEGGTIATSHQVISGARALEIRFVNGARYQKVDLLVDDADRDLALLRIDPSETLNGGPKMDAKPLTLGDSDTVVVSERAVSIGNPLGLEHTLTDGLISSHRVVEGRPWIQMSVPGSPGISGGPVFNMQGEVVGVTTAQIVGGIMGRAQNLNLAVPVNALKSMIRKDYPGRRTFGDPSSPSRW